MGSSQGSSQVSIFSAWTGSGFPGSTTHQVLGNTDASPPREQTPTPMDHVPAAPAKGPSHLTSQGPVIYPWDALTSSTGCASERAASQPGPRLPQPVLNTGRGAQPPPQQVPEVPGARSLLTSGQRQLCAGFAPASSVQPRGPGPVGRKPSREAYGRLGQQPPSEQRGALASCGQGRRAWAVREEQVRLWAAEILLALEGLHQQGVLCRDLNPRNLLLDAAGR